MTKQRKYTIVCFLPFFLDAPDVLGLTSVASTFIQRRHLNLNLSQRILKHLALQFCQNEVG